MPAENIERRRCATHDISVADRARLADLESTFLRETSIAEAGLQVEIPAAFIHVVDGGAGHITDEQRAKQLEVMNDAYSSVGVSFTFDESQVAVVDNPAFFRMGHQSLRERRCKKENQILDPTQGLNFYTAEPGGSLLGWATFPVDMEGDPDMDGVVILHSTLPDGSEAPYNLGATAVHELGHWLGLYHTFQDGCLGLGDEVADTPAHAQPNFGKPADDGQPHNLCDSAPAGSLCPIHNFMNYVDDDWMNEFTPGQKERMWAQIGMFRADLMGAGDEEEGFREAGQAIVW